METSTPMAARYWLAVSTGILAGLPLLLIALSGTCDLGDFAFVLLAMPPIVHFALSASLGWWDWRSAIAYCACFACVFLVVCCLPASSLHTAVYRAKWAAIAFAWPLPGWALARGLRFLIRSAYL